MIPSTKEFFVALSDHSEWNTAHTVWGEVSLSSKCCSLSWCAASYWQADMKDHQAGIWKRQSFIRWYGKLVVTMGAHMSEKTSKPSGSRWGFALWGVAPRTWCDSDSNWPFSPGRRHDNSGRDCQCTLSWGDTSRLWHCHANAGWRAAIQDQASWEFTWDMK